MDISQLIKTKNCRTILVIIQMDSKDSNIKNLQDIFRVKIMGKQDMEDINSKIKAIIFSNSNNKEWESNYSNNN